MMKKALLIAVAALGLGVAGANAGVGIFGTYIQLGSTWYGGTEWGANGAPNLQGANLGTFNVGDTLNIADAEVHTFKFDAGNITGADYNWRVWSGTPSGSFANVNVGFTANAPFTSAVGNNAGGSNDQNWSSVGSTPNILNGLSAGTYTLDVYFHASSNEGDGNLYDNGGSTDNYRATFTVVPEPSTMVMAALGVIGIVARRRFVK